MENFKVIIKPIKKKVVETDPLKIEALKEKRRLQREARKNKPKEETAPKEPKIKPDYSNDIENINKTVKNLVGFSIDEINEKLKASRISSVQVGLPINSDSPKETKKKTRK